MSWINGLSSVGSVTLAAGFMAVLGIALACLLALANRRLYVYEDPRIDAVDELLPKSNCGACGVAGCRVFAEQLVAGQVVPAQCTVNSAEQTAQIAALLGVAAGEVDRRVARLACAGGKHVAYTRARYAGLSTCRAATVVSGGGKECAWGCLGLGDCVTVCDQGAIRLDHHGLPIVDADKCTACNDCIEVCPKGLFSLESVSHRLWVACKNRALEDAALASCEVACTACGKCVAEAQPGLMALKNNLVEINYDWNDKAVPSLIDRCPTGAIVWFDTPNHAMHGHEAKKILRNEALPPRQ